MRVLALLLSSLSFLVFASTSAVATSTAINSGAGAHTVCPQIRCLFVCPAGTVSKKSTTGCPTCGCDPVTTTPPAPITTVAPIATPTPSSGSGAAIKCPPFMCLFVCPPGTVTKKSTNGCPACGCDPDTSSTPAPSAGEGEGESTSAVDSGNDSTEPAGDADSSSSPTSPPATTAVVATSTTTSSPPATTPAPKSGPVCGLLCMIACPYGHVMDARGCPLCSCNPPPSTQPALPSPTPKALTITPTTTPTTTTPTSTPHQLCGPVCMIYCPNGNVNDGNGCPTCRCNPSPTVSSSASSSSSFSSWSAYPARSSVTAIPFGSLPASSSSGAVYGGVRNTGVVSYNPYGGFSNAPIPTSTSVGVSVASTPFYTSGLPSTTSSTSSSSSLVSAINSAISARYGSGAQFVSSSYSPYSSTYSSATVGTPSYSSTFSGQNLGPSALFPGAFISGIKYGN